MQFSFLQRSHSPISLACLVRITHGFDSSHEMLCDLLTGTQSLAGELQNGREYTTGDRRGPKGKFNATALNRPNLML